MSPELFNQYADMRSRELRATAARQRRVRSIAGQAREGRFARLRAWLADQWPVSRQPQPCPTC